jgi:hypothetical protein
MSRPKPEVAEEKMTIGPSDSYYEKYPWGLRINLDNDALKKLGLKLSALTVGGTVDVTAKALVTSLSSDQNMENTDQKVRNRVELQITDLMVADSEDFGSAFKEAIDE